MKEPSLERIQEYIHKLCSFEQRVTGSENERLAGEYIRDLLSSFGFQDVREESFSIFGWNPIKCEVRVLQPVTKTIEAAVFPYSNSTTIKSGLVRLNHADTRSFEKTEGKIGLVPWGPHLYLSPMQSYFLARKQGLGALLVAAPDEGDLRKVVVVEVGGEMELPLLCISKEDGEELRKLTENSEVIIEISTTVERDENATSRNLEVVIKGADDSSHQIIVGAHYDAFFKGAADNAAPAAIVLELARIAKEYVDGGGSFSRTVRFLLYGAEECGSTSYYYWVNGSRAYVEKNAEIVKNAIAVLSLDSVGFDAPNYVASTLDLMEFAKSVKVSMKKQPKVVHYGPPAYGSDHWFFELSGVPTMYGVSFPSPYYHTQKDTPENLDYHSVEFHARFMSKALKELAHDGLLPHCLFSPLEEMESIISGYNSLKNNPFDLEIPLRKIRELLSLQKRFEKITKESVSKGDKKGIERANQVIIDATHGYNRSIGWVWRKGAPRDVSYLSRLELIADYVDLNEAISDLRRMPVANLDAETVLRYKSQHDNPFNWVDVHEALAHLESERSKVFSIVEQEISELVDFLDDIRDGIRSITE
jgi:Iap family predicted aminopeptidase